MALRFEITCYHEAARNKPERRLFLEEVSEKSMDIGETFDLGIRSGIVDDERPLLFAIRKREGSVQDLGYALFIFTLKRKTRAIGGEDAESGLDPMDTNTVGIEFDPSITLGLDNDWHPFLLTLEDSIEIVRVQVRWGPLLAPDGATPSGPGAPLSGPSESNIGLWDGGTVITI